MQAAHDVADACNDMNELIVMDAATATRLALLWNVLSILHECTCMQGKHCRRSTVRCFAVTEVAVNAGAAAVQTA